MYKKIDKPNMTSADSKFFFVTFSLNITNIISISYSYVKI